MIKKAVALIGAGRMGSIHGPNAAQHPDLELKYVVDHRKDVADQLALRCGAVSASLDQVLADSEVEGVLICSSTDQHLEHTLSAVAAGKAVFCEKPLDLDLELVREASENLKNAQLLLAFNRRFDPNYLLLKQRIDSGEIGQIESLNLVSHDPAAPPKDFIPTSGGMFKDFTIHELDLARWLLGEEIAEVFATGSCLVDPEIARLGDIDTARTFLKTASGKICSISNTRRSGYGYDQRVEAFGSAGMLSAGNVHADTVQLVKEPGSLKAAIMPSFLERYAQSYRAEMDHFADVVLGRTSSSVGFADGLIALELAEACGRSLASGLTIKL